MPPFSAAVSITARLCCTASPLPVPIPLLSYVYPSAEG